MKWGHSKQASTTACLPRPSTVGSFGPVIGFAPPSWPWALPHLYAANVYSGPDETHDEPGYVEIIGYWQGEFHVVDATPMRDLSAAIASAKETFADLPVRCLLERGFLTRENPSVVITGEWPQTWTFVRFQDLGVLSAYLFECATAAGVSDRAQHFKSQIAFAWPITEQVLVYLRALELAKLELAPYLPQSARLALEAGIAAGRRWL
jgi:hypothetical protein